MATSANYHNRYAALWVWTVFVTACVAGVCYFGFGVVQTLVESIKALIDIKTAIANWVIVAIAFVLVWWRVVKVVVLQGAPFLVGPSDRIGAREDKGETGRPVFMSFIGNLEVNMNDVSADYNGSFLFGCIFRSHVRSDKLMRARLEFLILALPFNGRLIVHNSRFSLRREDHQTRARRFRQIHDAYSRTVPAMSEDRFRQTVTQTLIKIAKTVQPQDADISIDGLRWRFRGSSGSISGYSDESIAFELDKGLYEVTLPEGQRCNVRNFDALRALAKQHLEGSLL